jgi:hypothetical protein
MMDPKRKKIYLVALVICLILSGSVLLYSKFSTSPTVFSPPTSSATLGTEASGSISTGFFPPAVFPDTEVLHTEIFDLDAFSQMQGYEPLDTQGQLRRPDPFTDY